LGTQWGDAHSHSLARKKIEFIQPRVSVHDRDLRGPNREMRSQFFLIDIMLYTVTRSDKNRYHCLSGRLFWSKPRLRQSPLWTKGLLDQDEATRLLECDNQIFFLQKNEKS
jgi:hypothetical protein